MLLISIAACQASPTALEQTSQPTGSATTSTPAVDQLPPTFTPQPSLTPTPQGPAGLDPEELDGVEVQFWHPWMEGMSSEVNALVREFNRTNEWGISVTEQGFTTSGELFETLSASLAEDPASAPDLVAAPGEQIAVWDAEYEAVLPIDNLLEQPQFGLTQAEREDYDARFWAQDRHSGRQLALPLMRSAHVLFYNKTWAAELGFTTPPTTPDQFEQQSCAAAVQNNTSLRVEQAGTGGWLIDTDALTLLSWMDAFGGDVISDREDAPYNFDTGEAEAALAFLRGLMDQGCAWLPRTQTRHEVFARRLALFVTGSLSDIPVQQQVSTRVGGGDTWVVLPFPAVTGQPHTWSSGVSLAVLRDPAADEDRAAQREQLAAWLFLRWLAAPPQAVQLAQLLPSLPVSGAMQAQLSAAAGYPKDLLLPLGEAVQPAPATASWRMVRRFLNDAAWQVFYLPTDQARFVLPQLDEAIAELLAGENP